MPASPALSWRVGLAGIANKSTGLFRLDHASRLDQVEAAFAKLGRNVDVRVREVA
jgi:hypothetical protein